MARIVLMGAVIGVMAFITVFTEAAAYGDDSPEQRVAGARLAFEPNQGQFDPRARFASRGPGYTLFLTETEAVMVLQESVSRAGAQASGRTSVVRFALENARARPPVALDRQPGIVNYLRGNDPAKWYTGIATYARVTYNAVYPGVDLVYYGNAGVHEYDLVVAPGADPSRIAMRVSGADRVDLDSAGNLQLATAAGTLTMRAPHVYQRIGAQQSRVEARYQIDEAGKIGFALGEYDTTAPLVIDPELVYSTFLGGSGNGLDQATGVAIDASGAAYIVGSTETTDFPTHTAIKPQLSGPADAFITKLSSDGAQILYSTYIGGTGYESGDAVAVRADGAAFVFGSTTSNDFPVVGGNQTQNGGSGDAFLVALDPAGTAIVRSTYLGGSGGETPRGLQLGRPMDNPAPSPDVFGDVVIVYGATTSTNFPTLQPGQASRIGDRDGFVTVFDRLTFQPLYSSYAGIPGSNYPEALQLKRRTGAMYMLLRRVDGLVPQLARFTPRAADADLQAPAAVGAGWNVTIVPLDLGSQQRQFQGELPWALETQITTIAPAWCGSSDWLPSQDPDGELFRDLCGEDPSFRDSSATDVLDSVVMATTMAGCIPVAPATQCSARAVAIFHNHDGQRVAHVNFGGQPVGRNFIPTRSVIARDGRIHTIGTTSDATLPVVNPVQPTHGGSSEGFVLTLDPTTGVTSFLSYLGGSSFDTLTDIAVDGAGNRWIVGNTQSSNFPVTPNGTQPALNGRIDGFVVKISADPPGPAAPTNLSVQTSDLSVSLSWNASAGATSYQLEAGTASGLSNIAVLSVGNVTSLQGQAPRGTYFARVRAITPAGPSAPSNEVQFALPCNTPPPATVAAFSKSGSLLTINWTPASGATIYGLLVGTSPGGSNILAAPVGNTLGLQANVAGLPAATYYVRVLSANECGISAASNELVIPLP